jgi:hypothetical protein
MSLKGRLPYANADPLPQVEAVKAASKRRYRPARHARGDAVKTGSQRLAPMTLAQRFKRAFRIEIEICRRSAGPVLHISGKQTFKC